MVYMTDLVPGGVEPIVAWRAWRAFYRDRLYPSSNPQLVSLYSNIWWEPHRAKRMKSCLVGLDAHGSPREDCTCGTYAFKEMDHHAWKGLRYCGPPTVIGRVALWGTVIEHELGYRAEYAYPLDIIPLRGVGDELVDALRQAYALSLVRPTTRLTGIQSCSLGQSYQSFWTCPES